MQRDFRVYLDDILDASGKIFDYTKNLSYEDFVKDSMVFDATIRNLEIIGEAIRKIPDEFHKKYPQIEWKKIISLRNILIHEYFGINTNIIWNIVQQKLLPLKNEVKKLLEQLDKPS